ncbi:MAG: RDD family protein [Acidobacteriota bacterium]|nr:MAG: RDD family protein [Acidobacteriota bacterium]
MVEPISGFLSEGDKKTFSIVAGALGAVFFIAQLVIPMAAMFAVMPFIIKGMSMKEIELGGAALFRGRVHAVEKSSPFEDRSEASSRLVRIGEEGLEEVLPFEGWSPRLLSDADRLWLISSERIATFDGQILQQHDADPLGDIGRPFLFEGKPAVIESRPEGKHLKVWRDGRWENVLPIDVSTGRCQHLQALETNGTLLLFRQDGDTLYARTLGEDFSEWDIVMSEPTEWFVFVKDGMPAVISSGAQGFRGVEFDGNRWTPFLKNKTTSSFARDVAAFQRKAGGNIIVVTQSFPGSLRVQEWDGERFTSEQRIGKFSPFPRSMLLLYTLPYLGTMILSLLLAMILSTLMRRHRVTTHSHEGREANYASLTRRALSQILDYVVVGLPPLGLFAPMFYDMETFLSGKGFFYFFGAMAGMLAWAVLVLFVYSFTEGRWGATPGKRALGIRVVGTDLQPCGFGRAFLRNILKLVDGFFNFLIGILLVAFTQNWQRLGDMAARTIVVRAGARAGANNP